MRTSIDILIENKNTADWTEKIISELNEAITSSGESWENQNIKMNFYYTD